MEKLHSTNKKAQIWGADLVIATVIFSVALVFLYVYTFNQSEESELILESLSYDGGVIADNLLSPGYPEYWNDVNVIQLGILSEGKINETKLSYFYNMTQNDYYTVKRLLRGTYNFYFFLDENMSINNQEIEGIGYPGITKENLNAENIIQIERITIYHNKPIGATVYVWK